MKINKKDVKYILLFFFGVIILIISFYTFDITGRFLVGTVGLVLMVLAVYLKKIDN